MARHFHPTDKDILEMSESFGIKTIRWEHISGGDANTSCLLEDERHNKYVLTILKDSSLAPELLKELLETLLAAGLPVRPPLQTKEGNSHIFWENQRVIIKPFVEGECSRYLSNEKIREAGTLLAKVHSVPPPEVISAKEVQTFNYSYLEDIIGTADPDYVDWLRDSLSSTDYLETSPLPRGLVHADFWGDNLVIAPFGSVVILDWEKASVGSFLYDIAWALSGLALDAVSDNFNLEKAKIFLNGYEQIRLLTSEEKELLGDALLRGAVVISCARYRRHYVLFPDPSYHDPEKYGKYAETHDLARVARSLVFFQ
jgi:homoserine kinase type II